MKVGALIILYNPIESEVGRLISDLLEQVNHLCLVDNSQSKLTIATHQNTSHLHFPENLGVAEAQNVGLKALIAMGCDRALILDQDSSIPSDFVFKLNSCFERVKKQSPNIVALGPSLICDFSNTQMKSGIQRPLMSLEDADIVRQIIASGMLVDLSKLSHIGFKDESLFIDGVDHEWCWRAQSKGFCVAQSTSVSMRHRLGNQKYTFFGLEIRKGYPVRLYYQFRNILLLMPREYVPLYWKARNLIAIPIRFVINSMIHDQKKQRVFYMLRGIWDGVLKRSGRFSENWTDIDGK